MRNGYCERVAGVQPVGRGELHPSYSRSIHVHLFETFILSVFLDCLKKHFYEQCRKNVAEVLLPSSWVPIRKQTNSECPVHICEMESMLLDLEQPRVLQRPECYVSKVMKMLKVSIR